MRYFCIIILLVFPRLLLAAEFFMETSAVTPKVDEEFSVVVYVNTAIAANVVAGTFKYDTELLALEKITFGGSLVNFWVERPSERQPGEITYSGIVAGGFTTTQSVVFTVHFKAKKSGTTTLQFSDTRILAHDGLGSELTVSQRPLVLELIHDIPGTDIETVRDIESPLYFEPELIQRDDWFEGRSVLVFDAVDKGTGIGAYYVKEYAYTFFRPFQTWRLINSPYVLEDQSLSSYVLIKAEDKSGNSIIVTIEPKNPRSTYSIFVLLLGGLLLLLWRYKKASKSRN